MKKTIILTGILVVLLFIVVFAATTIEDFFLPGSQVGQSGNIETPDRCDNCHGGYDLAVEPAFNWRGSMMSQAARDPLFYACLAIANQDAPDVGDLCLRCHTPDGWLNGRCVPTDGSALNNNDRQGVQCDFCHKMVKPTPLGVNPFSNDPIYTANTYPQDQSYLGIIIPIPGTSANGMYIADANNAKRGPFSDAVGRHQMFYSPFHSQSEHCGTCHDVSNPAFTRTNTSDPVYTFNTPGVQSPTFDLRLMLPVERTYSEWSVSLYNSPGTDDHQSCQDCHMRDVTGKGAKMRDAPLRTNLPLHDMTGGNTFVPGLVKQAYPAEINPAALDAGVLRARSTLQSAATMELTIGGDFATATVKIINNTGHKLPTGYPEGRRMWINLKALTSSNALIKEFGAYDTATAILNGDSTKVYEIHPGLSPAWAEALGLEAGPSFHFVLNDTVYFDNRIPPAGSTNTELIAVQSPVVGVTYPDGQNWDITTFTLPAGTVKVEARLYYQTTSREYVEFLRDENTTNSKGLEMYNLWAANGKSAPEVMAFARYPLPSLEASILSVTRITTKQGAYAQALVEVTCEGQPVEGASVMASFTGPTSGTASGLTNNLGQVILETTKKKNPVGQWCFTLTSVTKQGYNPATNLPTLCEPGAKSGPLEQETESFADNFSIYPNPARQNSTIAFANQLPTPVRIAVYNSTGKMMLMVVNGHFEAGTHTVEWDVTALPEGVYYISIQTNSMQSSKKIIVVR